jgi:lysophospholipase L1-like esterase
MRRRCTKAAICCALASAAIVAVLGGVGAAAPTGPVPASDFDGDGRAEPAIWRPSVGGWYSLAENGSIDQSFVGWATDIPVPGDYDGDGDADRAVWRPEVGGWYVDVGVLDIQYLGLPGDVPVPADYDGDGSVDRAVFRGSTGAWYILGPSGIEVEYFGVNDDVPVPADFDGDGRAEVAVFRPSTGAWLILTPEGTTELYLGVGGDIPVPGDHDGDGDAEPAVWRSEFGGWFVLQDGSVQVDYLGLPGDVPAATDYDGDGSVDIGIWRPSNGGWFHQSLEGVQSSFVGLSGDIPLAPQPAVYHRYFRSANPEPLPTVNHCGTLDASETWTASSIHVLSCSVQVAHGTTLTIEPGSTVKAMDGTQLVVRGALDAAGTAQSPVTFTSWSDDEVDGDTNGDGEDSVPTRSSWSGVAAHDDPSQPGVQLNLEHTVVKHSMGVQVNAPYGAEVGLDPVRSTVSIRNSTFRDGAHLSVRSLGDVSVRGNYLDNAEHDHIGAALSVEQVGVTFDLASTEVTGNWVSGSAGRGIEVRTTGSVEPVVADNTVADTGGEAFVVQASRLVANRLEGNAAGSDTVRVMALSGTLVSDMSIGPTGGALGVPLALGASNGGYLTVAHGATLEVAAGTVVKAFPFAGLGINGGLVVDGDTAQVTFTSMLDDSVGGDTNRDGSATVPAPNAWAGISANDSPGAPGVRIDLDRARLRYASGLTVSAPHGAEVGLDPVWSTVTVARSTFDTGAGIWVEAVGPVVVVGNSVTNTSPYPSHGIVVRQFGRVEAVSPTSVASNIVSGSTGHGIVVSAGGAIEPVVEGNSVSSTAQEAYAVNAERLVAAKLAGNSVGSNTVRAFALSGTLVSDLNLTSQGAPLGVPLSLGAAGPWNAPTGLTVAPGSTLTLGAGTIVKSAHYGAGLAIRGALIANGSAASPIVFTSMKDDTRGGDTNRDGNATTAARSDWSGIHASDDWVDRGVVLDLDHVELRYSSGVSVGAIYGTEVGLDPRPSRVEITSSAFNQGATISVDVVGSVALTGNSVVNTAPHPHTGIALRQRGVVDSVSATTVSGNSVSGATENGVQVLVADGGVEPFVQSNTVASTGKQAYVVRAGRLVGAKLSGNSTGANTVTLFALGGRLVSDLTLTPSGGAIGVPVSLGGPMWWPGESLDVAPEAALTIEAGTVLKATGGAGLDVSGSLVVNGTSVAPVVFTSLADDTRGGDTNRDGNATTPGRADWSGVRGSSHADHDRTVDIRHAVVRYAPGISLNDAYGVEEGPVPAVSMIRIADSTFTDGSTIDATSKGQLSVTGNSIANTAPLPSSGISLHQTGRFDGTSGVSVSANTVSGASGIGIGVSTSLGSEVSPVVQGNWVSATGAEAFSVGADRLRPSQMTGNSAAANTVRVMALVGRIVEDVTITAAGGPFGVPLAVTGAGPRGGESLYVAAEATMTLQQGVIVKLAGRWLGVEGALEVFGTPSSPVVLTSMRDDGHGGDTNRDGNATAPAVCDWSGLTTAGGGTIEAESLEIFFACTAVEVGSEATALLAATTITDAHTGASSSGYLQLSGAMRRVDSGVTCSGACRVDAREVDWGSPTGPFPYGSGASVAAGVRALPWVGFEGDTQYRFTEDTPAEASIIEVAPGASVVLTIGAAYDHGPELAPTLQVSTVSNHPGVPAPSCTTVATLRWTCTFSPTETGVVYPVSAVIRVPDGTTLRRTLKVTSGAPLYGHYVALGDSYSSGEGAATTPGVDYVSGTDTDDTGTQMNRCHRSRHAYPRLLDEWLTWVDGLVHAACSGAETWNLRTDSSLTHSTCEALLGDEWTEGWANRGMVGQGAGTTCMQYPTDPLLGEGTGQVSQLATLTEETDLVTITIGGNDMEFGPVLKNCVIRAVLADAGAVVQRRLPLSQISQTCPTSDFEADLAELPGRLSGLFTQIRANAPNARVLVGGYPRFFPDRTLDSDLVCDYLSLPTRHWINDRIGEVNDTIEQAVWSNGFEFVDLEDAFDGHERCREGDVEEWLNGLSNLEELTLSDKRYVSHSFHPNEAGQQAFAHRFLSAL